MCRFISTFQRYRHRHMLKSADTLPMPIPNLDLIIQFKSRCILFTQISEIMGIGIGKFQLSVNRQSFGYRHWQEDLVSAHHYTESTIFFRKNRLSDSQQCVEFFNRSNKFRKRNPSLYFHHSDFDKRRSTGQQDIHGICSSHKFQQQDVDNESEI